MEGAVTSQEDRVCPSVGIIANPSSGKDIRRIVARGSVFDNVEKANIVRRALVGLVSVGVRRVVYMPDFFGIVERATDGSRKDFENFDIEPLSIPVEGTQRDSTEAARAMVEERVGAIITLGGDGTNRAVAKASGSVPLVAVSTGTNNVFPSVVEGTLAGMAAGLVACHQGAFDSAIRTEKRLIVSIDGVEKDQALVDVALSTESFLGSRAVWASSSIRELVLAIAEPGSIGLSSIGAALAPIGRSEPRGLHAVLGAYKAVVDVLAAIAPGLIATVGIESWKSLEEGDTVELPRCHGSLALDGEREIVITPRHAVTVRLQLDGPRVADVASVLGIASRSGMLQTRNR